MDYPHSVGGGQLLSMTVPPGNEDSHISAGTRHNNLSNTDTADSGVLSCYITDNTNQASQPCIVCHMVRDSLEIKSQCVSRNDVGYQHILVGGGIYYETIDA